METKDRKLACAWYEYQLLLAIKFKDKQIEQFKKETSAYNALLKSLVSEVHHGKH